MDNFQFQESDRELLEEISQKLVDRVGQMLKVDLGILRIFQGDRLQEQTFIYRNPSVQLSNLDETSITVLAQAVWATPTLTAIDSGGMESSLSQQESSMRQTLQAAGIRASLLVPLKVEKEIVGGLGLHFCQGSHYWRENDIEIALMVADQLNLAIAQTQAYEKLRALAQREFLINSITAAIRSSLEPQAIFRAIVDRLGQALFVDGCALSLWTKEDEFVQCVGLYDRLQARIESLPQSIVPIAQNPVLQKLIATFEPVVLGDMEAHPEMNQFDLPLRSSARALLIVPLIVEGEILGSISLRQTEHSRVWREADIQLAQMVAAQAAIAVQQARLYETTKQQAEQLLASERQVKQLNQYLTESVLKRFLPPTMVNKIAAGELALDFTPEPRLVTVLFSDLVGFTPLATQLGSRRVAILLNEYLEAMTKAVFEQGGTVDKFIGDAVVALFGAPEELSACEQAKRAIAVARAMGGALERLNRGWEAEGLIGTEIPQVRFRCGIHQGRAVVGMFGGGQRSDYTAIGSAVNMAARLQEVAQANTILVSETVAHYLKENEIDLVYRVTLKGIRGEISAFSLVI